MSFQPCSGGVGGESTCGISSGRNGEFLQSEVASHSDGGRKSARFKGPGGVQAFILNVDVGKLAAGEHRGKPFSQRDRISRRQNGIVAPHTRGSSRETRRGERAFDLVKVVACVENSCIFEADRLRTVRRIVLAAASAFQMSEHRRW